MVNLRMKIRCPVCSKIVEFKNESGELNGEIGKFECEHYSGSVILETKIGWLLGTNAEVKYTLHIRCLRCNEENIATIEGSGLNKKSDYKLAQFCNSSHFLNVEYEQDSMVSDTLNKISGLKNYFWK